MKTQECILVVNTNIGYCFAPEKCRSMSEAVRKGKESPGFAYRVFVGNKVVKSGYCD